MVAVSLQPQNRILKTEFGGTISSQEEISCQLLDGFLKSYTRMAPTRLIPADSVSSCIFHPPILTCPLNIIKKILRNLLTSPRPLILEHDFIVRPKDYRTHVEPRILQVCQNFHNIGVPILYGENTLTASSPTTSFDFDQSLLSLPGKKRQLITDVELEIDWADQLWAKFPLVARALGELRSLATLVIVMVEKECRMEQQQQQQAKRRVASIEEDADLKIIMSYDGAPSLSLPSPSPPPSSEADKFKPTHQHHQQRAPILNTASRRTTKKRKGPVADAILKAEMKMLKDLVTGITSLRQFRLIGFGREGFADSLEELVRIGGKR